MLEGAVPPTPQRAKPLPLRIVSTKQNAGKLDFALEGTKQIVALLEDYFADAFPYPKLDQITSPIMPGAMENAGADLYGDGSSSWTRARRPRRSAASAWSSAHELAHQWFGDLVTPAWWDDIWLNESFANWMGYRIGDEWRPDLNIGAGALAEGFEAMDTDALRRRPADPPADRDATAQIDAAFDSHHLWQGRPRRRDDRRLHGRREIPRRRAPLHGRASLRQRHQHRLLRAPWPRPRGDPRILPAMQSFIDQQGVPLLTFAGSNGRYTVTQSRYARLGTTPPATRWGVPLCVRRDGRGCASC